MQTREGINKNTHRVAKALQYITNGYPTQGNNNNQQFYEDHI